MIHERVKCRKILISLRWFHRRLCQGIVKCIHLSLCGDTDYIIRRNYHNLQLMVRTFTHICICSRPPPKQNIVVFHLSIDSFSHSICNMSYANYISSSIQQITCGFHTCQTWFHIRVMLPWSHCCLIKSEWCIKSRLQTRLPHVFCHEYICRCLICFNANFSSQ